MARRRRTNAPRKPRSSGRNGLVPVLLIVAGLAVIGAGLYFFTRSGIKGPVSEKQQASKLLEMKEKHPDAEVFQLDEQPEPPPKKP